VLLLNLKKSVTGFQFAKYSYRWPTCFYKLNRTEAKLSAYMVQFPSLASFRSVALVQVGRKVTDTLVFRWCCGSVATICAGAMFHDRWKSTIALSYYADALRHSTSGIMHGAVGDGTLENKPDRTWNANETRLLSCPMTDGDSWAPPGPTLLSVSEQQLPWDMICARTAAGGQD